MTQAWLTEEMRRKIERACEFAQALENRNYTGNLSAGYLAEKGEEIANLGEAFQALNELVAAIRSLTAEPLRSELDKWKYYKEAAARLLGK